MDRSIKARAVLGLTPVATFKQTRKNDDYTINKLGIDSKILMENAGKAAFENILDFVEDKGFSSSKFVILAGGGNNGGDGYVIARYLKRAGFDVRCVQVSEPKTDECEYNYALCKKVGVEIFPLEKFESKLSETLLERIVVVDAVFGTGFKGKVEGRIRALMEKVAKYQRNGRVLVVAIDVPSGWGSEDGFYLPADLIVTFQYFKREFLTEELLSKTCVKVVDIGLFEPVSGEGGSEEQGNDLEPKGYMLRDCYVLLRKKEYSHKGMAGKVSIIAGNLGTVGAAIMCSRSCFLAGAGLVYMFIPEEVAPFVDVAVPEVVIEPYDSRDVGFSDDVLLRLEKLRVNSVVVGPGFGLDRGRLFNLKGVLDSFREKECFVVVDADGLQALDGVYNERFLITPHPAEAARLLDVSLEEVLQHKVDTAVELWKKFKTRVLLKGTPSVYFNGKKYFVFNDTEPSLAKAGSGDILAGILGSLLNWEINIELLKRGLVDVEIDSFDAAVILAVKLHIEAAKVASVETGKVACYPTKIVEAIPKVLKSWEGIVSEEIIY